MLSIVIEKQHIKVHHDEISDARNKRKIPTAAFPYEAYKRD